MAAALPSGQPQPNGDSGPFAPPGEQEALRGEGADGRRQPRGAEQRDGSPTRAEAACPGVACPAASLGAPEEGAGEGQDCGAPGDGRKAAAGEREPSELQCQGYCGALGQRCRAQVGGEEEKQLGKRKHRHRRLPSKKKKKLWKPYYQLSWEEKKKFDEKQSQRASRLRAEMFAKGQPVAPYNTTQFLMEDHDQEEPDLKTGLNPKKAAAKSDDTSEEDFVEEDDGGSDGMGGDGSEFLQKDFSETYERYHVESLQNMSKQELIREYLELEKCLSRMEEEINHLRVENKKLAADLAEKSRASELEQELDRLRAENQKLLKENQLSRQQEQTLSAPGE